MNKFFLLYGLVGALTLTPSVAKAVLVYTNLPFNLQDATDRGCNTKNQCSKGMVTWSVSTPYLNLWLADAPVTYTTSLGEEISFQVYFKQRDTLPPRTNLFRKWYGKASTLDGGGGGPPPDPPPPAPFVPPTGWNHNWFSYVRFSGKWYAANEHPTGYTNIMQDFNEWSATLHVPGGGEIDFTYNESGFESADSPNNAHITQVSLRPMNGTNQHIYPAITNNPPGPNVPFGGRNVYGQIGFRLVHADGSLDLYGRVTTLYGNAAIADALLTERIDPSGNATKFYYTNFVKDTRTIYLLTHVVDYDGKTNTLSYTTNQLLSRVDTPYGRFATFTYDHNGNLTNITDAATNRSTMDYTYDGTNYQWVPFSLTTPYGNTQFAFYDDGLGQTGNAGGTNRINRFLGITHDDGSKELFLYRFDSSQQGVPASVPSGLPNAPFYTLDAGNSGSSTNLTPFYTRNSFHWNRQQTAARSITNFTLANLATLTSNDYKLAVMTHWLVQNTTDETFLSDVPSMRQEASPDGIATGARVWFDQASKSQPYRVGDHSQSAACQLLPDGSTRWMRTDTEAHGLPDGGASSYELPDGSPGTRSVDYQYSSTTASQTCYITNTQISQVQWDQPMLSRIIGPQSEPLIALSDPVNESVTNIIVTNNVAYTYITTRPQRRQLTLTNALNETATAWFNSRQQLAGARWFNGVTLTNLYDANGWLAKTINLSGQATNSVSFANGLLLTHTNALGLARQFSWDALERLATTVFPDNTGFTNGYNKLHLASQTDRLGNSTLFFYDKLAQLTNITDALSGATRLSYCVCGSPDQVTDPANASTSYTHDYNGRLRYEVDSDNFTRTYTRNTIGQVTNLTDTAGNNLTLAHNHQGLIKRVSNPTGTLYQVVYDIRDRPIYVTNTYGAVVTNSYDGLNRPLTRTLLNNGVASTETWTYTTNGLATHTDPQGRITRYGYDSAGRLAGVTNANQQIVSATFNKVGQMLSLTDGRNKTTRWAYDLYGRMVAETNANGVLVRTNGYDPNGRLTNQWTAAKGKATYVYDAVGNLTAARYPTFTNTYTYDALNRMLTATSSSGSLTRTYTNLGAFQSALKTEDGPWADDTLTFYRTPNRNLDTVALVEPGAAVPRTWEFGYDGLNRLKTLESFAGNFTNVYTGAGSRLNRMNLPGGNWITNWFDPAGQLLGRWLKTSGGNTLDSYLYTHDLTGLRTNLVRSDGTYANYIYDPIGQLTNAVAREPGGALRRNENFAYTYDAGGNLATRLNATLTQTFSVDNANRLTSATRSGTLTAAGTANTLAQSVSVNNVGADLYTDKTFATTNGLTLTNGTNQLRFKATDAQSQSVTITQIFNLPASVSYTYDLNGNLISDGSRGYDYDDADRLTRITATNQWKSEFVYDGFGRRLIRREYVWQSSTWSQTEEVRYVWLGMSVIQERDAANNVRVTYTGRLAREDATSTSFYFADGNGNISTLVDSSGIIKARYRYDSFGNMISKSGPLADANLIRFSGKEYHANSGLYYYGFRFYAPNLQRWMNQDPINLAGGINLYAFVGNDPMNLYDPYGLSPEECSRLRELAGRLRKWEEALKAGVAHGTAGFAFGILGAAEMSSMPQLGMNLLRGNGLTPNSTAAQNWTDDQFANLTKDFDREQGLVYSTAGFVTEFGLNASTLLVGGVGAEAQGAKLLPKAAPALEKALANGADDVAKAIPKPCPPSVGGKAFRVMSEEELAEARLGKYADGPYMLPEHFGKKWVWPTREQATKWKAMMEQGGEKPVIAEMPTRRPLAHYEAFPHETPPGPAYLVPFDELGPAIPVK